MAIPTNLESYFLQLINQTRAAAGAKPLSFDGELLNASDAHSAWMDQTDTFSHTGVNGSSPATRMTAAGYGWQSWGENIAYASGPLTEATVQRLHSLLVNSPGHYANIVNGAFEEIGIGLKVGTINGFSVVFVTEDFGTPNAAERAEPNDVGAVPVAGQTILGDSDSNSLVGTTSNDTLNGNGGADYLLGRAGNDRFVFDTVSEATGDVVRDFGRGADRIDLSNIDADTLITGNQAFRFIDTHGFTGTPRELRVYSSGASAYLAGDTDGDGRADFTIQALGNHTFVGSDFIL